jgi:FAD/FMN-containing dehydrogenase
MLTGTGGIGGLTTGGGISFFSPRYGWTCDTATNFEVVLADGSIINANNTSNQDLFTALRGGNNNFGIVTRIDLRTFEQGLIWAGNMVLPVSSVDNNISEFVKINSADKYDEYASLITTFVFSAARNMSVISNLLEYTKAEEGSPNPSVFEGILNLPSLFSTTKTTNMATHSHEIAALRPSGPR